MMHVASGRVRRKTFSSGFEAEGPLEAFSLFRSTQLIIGLTITYNL